MTKIEKLKICDWTLVVVLIFEIASSFIMEFKHGRDLLGIPSRSWTAIHIALSLGMFALMVWHLYLHYGFSGWWSKICKLKIALSKWLFAISAFVLTSGLIVSVYWLMHYRSHVKKMVEIAHGKIGFLLLALCVWHIIRHFNWFCSKKN